MADINNVQGIIPIGTVLSANKASMAISLQKTYAFAIQIVITGTPTGTFHLEGSCDRYAIPTATAANAPVNWTTIANTDKAVSAAGSVLWSESFQGYTYVRAVYVDGSSGMSTAIVTVASFNGN